jgi:Flp pilus assembly secretin CpaC
MALPDPNSTVPTITGMNLGGFGTNALVEASAKAHTWISSTVLGFALAMPASTISFFQSNGKAKLLASTQVHILDGEDQSIKIGQRVPIQTAAFPTFSNPTPLRTGASARAIEQSTGLNPAELATGLGGAFNGFAGNAFPQIQYENVGLNIDMKPQVFEDEVQLKMKISATSLDTSTGKLTPSFNQREMASVARIKDGKSTMIAGVSQTTQSKETKGIPILGLLPILGRFFVTPDITDKQSDVVITVTPHILRRADITDRDHLTRAAGYSADPATQLSIQQIIEMADFDTSSSRTSCFGRSDHRGTQTSGSETRPAQRSPASISETRSSRRCGNTACSQSDKSGRDGEAGQVEITKETVTKPRGQETGSDDDDDDDDDDDAQVNPNSQANNQPVFLSVKSARRR